MKKSLYMSVVLMLYLLCGGCSTKPYVTNDPITISEDAMVQEVFYMGNQLFSIRADGNKLCLIRDEKDPINDKLSEGITLVEMRADGDGTAQWWPSQEKIVITKGSAVYLYDIQENTSEVIWEMAKSKKSNCVNLPCMGEEWIIIQENYGTKNSGPDSAYVPYVYNTKEYSAFNVVTGEIKTLFKIQNNELVLTERDSTLFRINEVASVGNGIYINGPEMICLEEGNLYILMGKKDPMRAEEEIAVLRVNLEDMSIIELGTYEGSHPFNTRGFVYEETLYFSENTYGIYSVSTNGGEVSFNLPDSQFYLISDMQRKGDSLFLVLVNGTTNPDSIICQWDPETNEIRHLIKMLSDYYSVFWTGESFCAYYTGRGSLYSEYMP